jgi:hypothetical protein
LLFCSQFSFPSTRISMVDTAVYNQYNSPKCERILYRDLTLVSRNIFKEG